jgi:phage host-nuclease inhibitor protein Gam
MNMSDQTTLFNVAERPDEDGAPRVFVRVPFQARENFKAVFAGLCHWHQPERLWSVPPHARDRLHAWIGLARPIARPSQLATAIHLTTQEIEQTRDEIAAEVAKLGDLAAKREELKALRATLSESCNILKAEREKVEPLDAEISYEAKRAEEQRAAFEAALGHLIDLGKLRAAAAQMTLLELENGPAARHRWGLTQLEFVRAKNALADAGLRLEAVDFFAGSRKSARTMPPGAWDRLTRL